MTDTTREGSEQLWERVQSIEFEPLYEDLHEKKDDVSEFNTKLTIGYGVNQQIPLFASLGFYDGSDLDPCYNKTTSVKDYFHSLFPDIRGRTTSWNYVDHSEMSWTLFNVKKCFENGDSYIFISDTWNIFSAQKNDFDVHWLKSISLRLLSKSPKFGEKSLTKISDSDWKIKYYLQWNLIWTLQWSCFAYVQKSIDLDIVYVWHKSYVYKSKLKKETDSISKKDTISHDDSVGIDLGLWEIKKLTLDPKQNLLFVISEDEEWKSNLHILDNKKLFNEWDPIIHEIKTIEWIVDIIFEENWNFILQKSDWAASLMKTNLNSLSSWWSFEMKKIKVNKGQNQTKKDVLDSLWTLSVSIDTTEISNEWDEDDKKIIEWIWWWMVEINWTSKTLKELFDDASTEDDIEIVKKIFFQIIKQNEKLNSVPDLLKKIENQINEKKNRIFLDSIFSELEDICEELKTASSLETLFTMKEKLQSIQKKRRGIQAWASITWIKEKDKELKLLLETVDQQIKDYQEAHKDELEDEIEKNLELIKSALDDIENAIDISSIYTSSVYKATEDMISHLDKEWQQRFKKKLNDLKQNRLKEIKEASNKAKKEKEELIEIQKKEAEESINQIKDIIEEVDDIDAIEQFKENDPLVLKTKDLLSKLPSTHANALDLKLEKIFWERIFTLRLKWEEAKWLIQNLDTYWIDTILYYDEDWSEQVEWKIEWKEKSDWKISLVVKLMNGETHEYDKSLSLKPEYAWIRMKWKKKWGNDWELERKKIKFDMDEDEFYEYQNLLYEWKDWGKGQEYRQLLKKLRALKQTWKDGEIGEEKQQLLAQIKSMREKYWDVIYTEHLISRLIKQQKINPRSKVPPFDPNFIVLDEEKQILKELSTRLVDQKQNSWIQILEWWPWLWKTVMCEFLASVTNREIVRVQCSKMDPSDLFFAPTLKKWETSREPADWIKLMQKPWTIVLFDEIDKLNDQCFERLHSLFDRGRSVYDPQLGTIKANPDCLFLWTRNSYDRLSNPIISRWRILQINYPWVLNESYKVSKYTDNSVLKKLSYEEFQMLYDKYITRSESAPKNAQERKIYDLMINIHHLINVFTELREQYDSDEPFTYELSYRDARQIFVDYNSSWDFKKSMENVLIPKARAAVVDSDDKKIQEDKVRDAIKAEM